MALNDPSWQDVGCSCEEWELRVPIPDGLSIGLVMCCVFVGSDFFVTYVTMTMAVMNMNGKVMNWMALLVFSSIMLYKLTEICAKLFKKIKTAKLDDQNFTNNLSFTFCQYKD